MNSLRFLLAGLNKCAFQALNDDPREAVKYWRKKGAKIGDSTLLCNVSIDGKRPYLLSIGNGCVLTNCRILTHDASMNYSVGATKIGTVSIGDNVFVGMGAIILPGVKIGNKVVVGAGTVVAKDVPDNTVCVGNPMKFVSTFDDFREKHLGNMSSNLVFSSESEIRERIEELSRYGSGYIRN